MLDNNEDIKVINGKNVKLGLVARCYASSEDQALKYKSRVMQTIVEALSTELYDIIYILIPIDHDSGHSEQVIRDLITEDRYENVEIILAHGYHSREAENVALAKASEDGVTHITYISNKASCYLDKETTLKMLRIFKNRNETKEVGVSVDSDFGYINMEGELGVEEMSHGEFIKLGFAQNTYNTWEVESLLAVGGFDPWQHDGCEEAVPQYRISKLQNSPCLEIISVDDNKKCNIGNSERHAEVLAKKWINAKQELEYLNVTPEEFIRTTLYKVN